MYVPVLLCCRLHIVCVTSSTRSAHLSWIPGWPSARPRRQTTYYNYIPVPYLHQGQSDNNMCCKVVSGRMWLLGQALSACRQSILAPTLMRRLGGTEGYKGAARLGIICRFLVSETQINQTLTSKELESRRILTNGYIYNKRAQNIIWTKDTAKHLLFWNMILAN